MFPAAAHLSMAIEALRQVYEIEGQPFECVTLRDVNIKTALVVPDDNDGVETILRLQTAANKSDWHFFAIECLADGVWTVHCDGRVSAAYKPIIPVTTPVDESALTQRVSGKRWFSAFERVGFYYGRTFQKLQSVQTDRSIHQATGKVTVETSSGVMQGESRYLLHPSTVDACLHLIIISIHAGKHKEMPWGVVPTRIEEVSLFPAEQDAASTGHAVAWTDDHDEREFNTNVRLTDAESKILLNIKNLTCITFDAAIPASSLEGETGPEPYSIVSWKPDIKNLKSDVFEKIWPGVSCVVGRFGKLIELVSHRQHLDSVLICGSPAPEIVEAALAILPKTVAITIAYEGQQDLHMFKGAVARTTVITLPDSPKDWVQVTGGLHDLVLVDYSDHQPSDLSDALIPLVKNGGWLIGFSQQFPAVPSMARQLGQHFALFKKETYTNGVISKNDDVTILSLHGSRTLRNAVLDSSFNNTVREKSIQHFSPDQDLCVVIDDTSGTLLSAMTSDAKVFEAVKRVLTSGVRTLWLTQGVKQGQKGTAGMAEGLLRTICSEQAAVRIVLLDIDQGETPENVGKAITSKLSTADTKESGHDTEFWLHKGTLHISRVYPHEDLNQKESQAQEKILPSKTLLKAENIHGRLVFEPHTRRPHLSAHEVEAQIHASELQRSISGSQLLVCGTILRVGSSVDESFVGRRIVALSFVGLETVLYTSAYAILDEDKQTSPETLLSKLLPLYPMVNLCLFRNNMAGGDFLLSLPGPKPAIATLISLAKAVGWKLTVVVNSLEEKEELTSQLGLGPEQVLLSENTETILTLIRRQCNESYSDTVDIIAHDFSSLAQEIWRCIPAFCRFMVNNPSSEVAPDPLPFTRGATFISSNLKALRATPKSVTGLLKRSLQMLKIHPDIFVASPYSGSVKVVNVADAGVSLNTAEQQSESSIVRFGYDESQVKVTATTHSFCR